MTEAEFALDLQLFAESGAEAGVNEADAGPEAEITTEENDREKTFEQLISGEYKDLYDERLSRIIQKRVKNYRERAERCDRLEPLLEKLGEKYGSREPEELLKALEQPARRVTEEELGRTRQTFEAQAAQARQLYPDLDLRTELADPRFRQLLLRGVDVRTAYEAAHRDQLLPGLLAAAARQAEEKLAHSLASNGRRPAEGGSLNHAAAVMSSSVSALSRADMADIERRVRSGERISFG